jgi:signal transduction histidine kinase
MKLALEIALALALAILVVMAGAMAIGVERELRLVDHDLRRDHLLLGTELASAVAAVWKAAGPEEALKLLRAGPAESRFSARWRWLDDPTGVEPRLTPAQSTRLRSGDPVSLSFRGPDGIDTRLTLIAVRTPEGRIGAVELRERLLQEPLWARGVVTQAALTVGAVVVVSGALAVALGVFLVGRPIRQLVAKAQRIGAGDLTGEIVLARRNELGELALEMNAMARKLGAAREEAEREASERIAALDQLRHADRLTTIGKLASGIGHELGTPLAIVTGRAELILDAYPKGSPAHDSASIVLDQARKMAAIIRQFLDFARRRHAERARNDVRQLLEQTLGLLSTLADRRSVSLELEANGPAEWDFDAFLIQQALTNLLVNGIQATPPGAKIVAGYEIRAVPRAGRGDGSENGSAFLHLYVRDRGGGMSGAVLERAFEPFFTTKEIGEGTGLGLSIAQGIVRDHGGWIDVTSEVGNGSQFSIWLPDGEAS